MKIMVIFHILGQLVGYVFSLWFAGSLALSAWKTYKNECGTKSYGIERYYIDGDFFCERK